MKNANELILGDVVSTLNDDTKMVIHSISNVDAMCYYMDKEGHLHKDEHKIENLRLVRRD